MTNEFISIEDFKKKIEAEQRREKYSFARKVIVDKNCRPGKTADQFDLLLWVSNVVDLPSYKLLAVIASGHKALECLNYSFCNMAIEELKLKSELLSHLESTDKLREDSLHTTYSFLTVNIYLLIFLEKWDELEKLVWSSTANYEKKGDFKVGFYQTCGNVYRCYGFQFLLSVSQLDYRNSVRILKNMEKVLFKAMEYSDDNFTKFKEYTTYVISLGKARELVEKIRNERETFSISDAKNFTSSLMRWQNPQKVDMLTDNLINHLKFRET